MSINSRFHKHTVQLICLFAGLFIFSACEKTPPQPTYTPPDSSFGLIYSNIFATSCALSGCHVSGEESPLLAGEDVYQSIVGVLAANGEARQLGLQLIKPADVDSSFMYQKLVYDSTAFPFGAPMPQGGLSLSDNQIAFVKEWIEAGAPQLGHIADRFLIE
ncbi:MAG: hypothetical protein AAFN10_00970 [Bacteroidota bacterium]